MAQTRSREEGLNRSGEDLHSSSLRRSEDLIPLPWLNTVAINQHPMTTAQPKQMARTVEKRGEVLDQTSELHVLAVDDSHLDRKFIERLLKISVCKVTVVESGSRALQYLGFDGEKSSVGFNNLKTRYSS